MKTTVVATICLLVACSVAACRTAEPSPQSKSASPSPTSDSEVDTASDDGEEYPSAVTAARQRFAAELGVEADEVVVVEVEPVTWNDSSLGCPQPGQSYLQVLTPGYRVRLEADGQTAVYHTGRATGGAAPAVVRCDKWNVTGLNEPVDVPELPVLAATALDAARTDLQERIGEEGDLTLEDIGVADVTDLVCDSNETVATAEGPAKVILELRLRHGQDVHIYRSWSDDIIYCGLAPGPAVE